MKTPFPFESVYEQLARALLLKGLPTDGDVPPVLMIIATNSAGTIVDMDHMPLAQLFADNAGKDVAGRLLSSIVPHLPPHACAVLVSEAYTRSTTKEPDENWKDVRKKIPDNLADDPESTEILLIQLYRPDEVRMGGLPILPGRQLKYMPLHPAAHMQGRLIPRSVSGEGNTKH